MRLSERRANRSGVEWVVCDGEPGDRGEVDTKTANVVAANWSRLGRAATLSACDDAL